VPQQGPSAPGDDAGRSSAADAARELTGDVARTAAARRLRPDHALPGLDRLARLAAQLLGTSSAQVSLLTDVDAVAGGTGAEAHRAGDENALDQALCSLTAAAGAPLAIPDTWSDARVSHLTPVTTGGLRSYLGVPLTVGAEVVGAVCVGGPDVRQWSAQDVDVLQQVATAAGVELELAALGADFRASQALLEVAVQAAGIGTFDLDVATGRLVWDDVMHALFGLSREEFDEDLGAAMARIHPDDQQQVVDDMAAALSTGVFSSSYRVLLPDGGLRWLEGRGRTLGDAGGHPVRLVGAVHDVTAQRRVSERIAAALESLAVGYLVLDGEWRLVYANAEAERITGTPRAQLLGRTLWETFPATVGTVFEEHYRRALATGEPEVFEAYYPAPLDLWTEVRAIAEGDGLALYFLDVTARTRAQQAVEAAAARLDLLARVTAELTGTFDADRAVARLAQLVVPSIADWCVVTLVDDDAQTRAAAAGPRSGRPVDWRRGLRDVGCWHRDEDARPHVEAYTAARMGDLTDAAFLERALRSGRPVHVADAARRVAAVLDPDGEAVTHLRALDPAWGVVLPLRGRGRTVGLMTLFGGPGRPPLADGELATAEEVATRAGLALDSSRLYRQQRDLAEGLQRSLLSEPPEPDHGQIVVRYVPAAEAAQVGGDWYDAFLQPGGATVLVIGDVVGHDTQAAAAMSQVRTVVRTLGALGDDTPAQVLSAADRVLANLQIQTTATAVVARLEQDEEQRRRGVTRLRWSSAGHPPVMLVRPDGSVTPLTRPHADLLLGVVPDTARADDDVVLEWGSTVLLYTDGLVERRDQPLQEGLERLQAALERLAADGRGLDDLVDGLLSELVGGEREDDVALVAVRLHRQDRPRPAEAGPHRIPPHVPPDPGDLPGTLER